MCRAVQMIHAEMNAYTLEELADLGVNVPDIVIDVDGARDQADTLRQAWLVAKDAVRAAWREYQALAEYQRLIERGERYDTDGAVVDPRYRSDD